MAAPLPERAPSTEPSTEPRTEEEEEEDEEEEEEEEEDDDDDAAATDARKVVGVATSPEAEAPSLTISSLAAPMPTPGSSREPTVPRSRPGGAPEGGLQPRDRIACGSSTAREWATLS